MALLQVGPIRMAVLNSSGVKLKTLILPTPSKDGLELEWAEKSTTTELIDGSEKTRFLGFIPQLTVKWSAYDESVRGGIAIGTNDGQRPTLESLLPLLVNNMVRVSPGMTAGGFTAAKVEVRSLGKQGLLYTGLQVVFRGGAVRAQRDLEVF